MITYIYSDYCTLTSFSESPLKCTCSKATRENCACVIVLKANVTPCDGAHKEMLCCLRFIIVNLISHSLNCSRVVSASLGCSSNLLGPISRSALPPNMVTSVSPGPRLKAVRECLQRGFRVALTYIMIKLEYGKN